jgi:hypothetical protein
MSRATKVYILIICFALIFILGTGVGSVRSNDPRSSHRLKWLASMSGALDIRLRETLGPAHEMDGISGNENGIENHDLPPIPEPAVVKGVYLTSWIAGTKAFDQVVEFIHKTEVNSLVIDVKDDTGLVSYASKVPLVNAINSSYKKYDPQKIMTVLRQNQIYPIARIVVFKDPYLAKHRPDLAVKNSAGGLWQDYRGLNWVDPYNKEVWDYNISIAKEAIQYGFREIQFDYVRFTSDGNIRECRYPKADGRIKSDVIRDYLKYAYQELKPLGVKVSADVFGLTCSAQDDMGIGQVMEKVAEGVDVVCPMVYPSHYYRGQYQIADPDSRPYETVFRSLTDAKQKIANVQHKVIIRPWLQDFSLKNHYGREQLLEQIKAVENSGFKEWIFWNPSSRYDYHKYRLKTDVPIEMPTPVPEEPSYLETQPTVPISNP